MSTESRGQECMQAGIRIAPLACGIVMQGSSISLLNQLYGWSESLLSYTP